MENSLFERPLAIGAHCDDVELFAGGTIARFARMAFVLCFSLHKGVHEASPREMEESMKALGVSSHMYNYFTLAACQDGQESFHYNRGRIYEQIAHTVSEIRPSVIVTHQSSDTNQDHQQVYQEVLRARKNVSTLGGQFLSNDLPPASRGLFVQLDPELMRKKGCALSCYASQKLPHRPYMSPEYSEDVARYNGRLCGSTFAEAFEVIRIHV